MTSDISCQQQQQQQPADSDVIAAEQSDVVADRMTSAGDDEWKQSASSFTSSQCSVDTVQNIAVTSPPAAGHGTEECLSENQPIPRDVVDDHVTSSNNDEAGNQPKRSDQDEQQPEVDKITPETGIEHQQMSEFKTGVICSDVPAALDILNTRYRLADVTVHKNMITWSSWNVADIVRGPHRDSGWWRTKRQQNGDTATPPRDNQLEAGRDVTRNDVTISTGTMKDIKELSRRIEMKEREIEFILQKIESQSQPSTTAPTTNHDADDVITPEVHQQTCAERSPAADNKQQNLLQRFLAAVRRRFTHTTSPNTPADTPTPTHRQRTL